MAFDQDEFRRAKKSFLNLLGGKVIQLEDTPLSLKAGFEKLLKKITEMEKGREFSIPVLILLIDELITWCDFTKNQLIELKWFVKFQRSYLCSNPEEKEK